MKSKWTVEGNGYHCIHLEWCKMDVKQQKQKYCTCRIEKKKQKNRMWIQVWTP